MNAQDDSNQVHVFRIGYKTSNYVYKTNLHVPPKYFSLKLHWL